MFLAQSPGAVHVVPNDPPTVLQLREAGFKACIFQGRPCRGVERLVDGEALCCRHRGRDVFFPDEVRACDRQL
jgi:hypothetical protein